MPRINTKKAKTAFTLVELLVAIAIMGILAIIALPAISNIKNENDKLQYKKYKDSFIIAGKLYNDSFAEDLFGRVQSGCADVEYETLQDKNLIKDIQLPDVDCSTFCSGETDEDRPSKVRIRRVGDQYFYEAFMCCTKSEDGITVYETNNASHYDDPCKVEAQGEQEAPKINVNMKYNNADPKPEDEPYKITNANLVKAIVNISDIDTGNSCLSKDGTFHYEWIYSKNDNSEIPDTTDDNATDEETEDEEDDDSEEEEIDESDIEEDTPDEEESIDDEDQGEILAEGDIKLSNYINGCNTSINVTLNAPTNITNSNIDGIVTIKITPTKITDAVNNRIPKTKVVKSTIVIDNTEASTPEPEPGAPTVKLFKFTGSTSPTSSTGLSKYTNNTWYSGNVYTEASGGNTSCYRFTVKGASTNVTKKLGNHRSIKANGKSTIKYCSAKCSGDKPCVKWSPTYTILLDETKPKCSISKSNTGTTSGVTLKTTCKDSTSGVALCAGSKKKYGTKYTVTKKNIKSSVTYTVKDRAGNSNTCKTSVTSQRQKRTRSKTCVSYKQTCTKYETTTTPGWNCPSCGMTTCTTYKPTTCPCNTQPPSRCTISKTECASYRTDCTKYGWSNWSSWSNVSKCSKSNTTQCRTIYK